MLDDAVETLIEPTTSLQFFFKERIESAVEKHSINGNEDTLWYLTQLLCNYSRTSSFLDSNGTRAALTPLAEYYRQAIESVSAYERRQLLQRLGDVAMVVSGLFSGALNRKAVGVDYYISMGEAAYSTLADESPHSSRERSLQGIFEALANDFSDYVVALSEVPVKPDEPKDLMTLIDDWQVNKHPTVARKLRSQGVVLLEGYTQGGSTVHH
ncbi:MAG: hypothetical protein AB8B87_19165 [Granulosicoccus sp.]